MSPSLKPAGETADVEPAGETTDVELATGAIEAELDDMLTDLFSADFDDNGPTSEQLDIHRFFARLKVGGTQPDDGDDAMSLAALSDAVSEHEDLSSAAACADVRPDVSAAASAERPARLPVPIGDMQVCGTMSSIVGTSWAKPAALGPCMMRSMPCVC